ncbi:MAG TPA: hypothetical protein PLO69_03975 [Gammaproteobacteria bacterium]|nr:hypothetical protein [Gammaproteobacteria bacterium]
MRPPGVRLIAWMWILTGVMNAYSAVAGWFGAGMVRGLLGQAQLSPHTTVALALPLFMAHHADALGVFQLGSAALAILAGIDFLRLRAWARACLEALSWLSLAYILAGAVYWWLAWSAITAGGSVAGVAVDLAPYRTPGLVLGCVLVLAFAIPMGLVIRTLRGSAVRCAVSAAG